MVGFRLKVKGKGWGRGTSMVVGAGGRQGWKEFDLGPVGRDKAISKGFDEAPYQRG